MPKIVIKLEIGTIRYLKFIYNFILSPFNYIIEWRVLLPEPILLPKPHSSPPCLRSAGWRELNSTLDAINKKNLPAYARQVFLYYSYLAVFIKHPQAGSKSVQKTIYINIFKN